MKSVAAVAAGCAGGQLAVVEPGQRLLGLVEAPEVDVGRAVLRPDVVHLQFGGCGRNCHYSMQMVNCIQNSGVW